MATLVASDQPAQTRTLMLRGYLLKRTETRALNTWHRRFWVLMSDGALLEYKHMRSYGNGAAPMRTITVGASEVDVSRDGRNFCFTFFSDGRRFMLRCDSETRFNRWRRAFGSTRDKLASAASERQGCNGDDMNDFVERVMSEIGDGTSSVMRAFDDTGKSLEKALVSPFVGKSNDPGHVVEEDVPPPIQQDAHAAAATASPRPRSAAPPSGHAMPHSRDQNSVDVPGNLMLTLPFAGADSMEGYDDIVPSSKALGFYRFESDGFVQEPVDSLVLYDRGEAELLKTAPRDSASKARQRFPLRACANESDAWALEHIRSVYITPLPIREVVHLTVCLTECVRGDLKHFTAPDFEITQQQVDWGARPRLYFTPKSAVKRPLLQAALSIGFGPRGEGWSSQLDADGHEIWVIQRPPYVAIGESGEILATFVMRNPGTVQISALLTWCTKFRLQLPRSSGGSGSTSWNFASIKFEVAAKLLMKYL